MIDKEGQDSLAYFVRLLSLSTLTGAFGGLVFAATRLKKFKDSIEDALEEGAFQASGILATSSKEVTPLGQHINILRRTRSFEKKKNTKSDDSKELTVKQAFGYDQLTIPEQKLYDLFADNQILQGFIPLLFLVSPTLVGISVYSVLSRLGLKNLVHESEREVEKRRTQLEKRLKTTIKTAQQNSPESSEDESYLSFVWKYTKGITGYAMSLGVLGFLVLIPIFYKIFSQRTSVSEKDIAGAKILTSLMPSPIPIEFHESPGETKLLKRRKLMGSTTRS